MIVCMVEAFLEKRSCQTQLIMLVEDLARNAGFGRADSTGLVFAMFCARLFICASWSPAGKGLTSWLSFVVSSVSLSLSH